ncbi:uncharacterized protein N7458_000025, partial [Penicillium daleae]
IKKWIEHQNQFPLFSSKDWSQLQQLELILSKFEEFTQLVSRRQSQISLAIPIYYELHDTLEDAASAQTAAVSVGMKKYKKYYELMDSQDAYYIALILDPRFEHCCCKYSAKDYLDSQGDLTRAIPVEVLARFASHKNGSVYQAT